MSAKITPYRRALMTRIQNRGSIPHHELSPSAKAQIHRIRKVGFVDLGQPEGCEWGWHLTDAGRQALEGNDG